MAAYELIGDIVKNQILDQNKFMEKLEEIFFKFLTCNAAEVRVTGVRILGEIASMFGTDWCLQSAVPKINNVL